MKIETFCFFIKKNFGGSFEKRFSETSNDFSYIYDSQFGVFAFVYKNERFVECNNLLFDLSCITTEEQMVDYFISIISDEKARRLLT